MPELPEVETVKLGLEKLCNQKLNNIQINNKNLRWEIPESIFNFNKQVLTNITRRGKYLLWHFNNNQNIIIHLGMSATIRFSDNNLKKHDHVIFNFSKDNVIFNDPRRFGCILPGSTDRAIKLLDMGIEPLSTKFNHQYLKKILQNKQSAIKTAIMNSKIVVGIGNIYACEILFLSNIHPLQPASSLNNNQLKEIVENTKKVLTQAIECGGSSIKNFSNSNDKLGYFQNNFKVYNQEDLPCYVCKTHITKIVTNNRSTYFCKQCQKLSIR